MIFFLIVYIFSSYEPLRDLYSKSHYLTNHSYLATSVSLVSRKKNTHVENQIIINTFTKCIRALCCAADTDPTDTEPLILSTRMAILNKKVFLT